MISSRVKKVLLDIARFGLAMGVVCIVSAIAPAAGTQLIDKAENIWPDLRM